MQMIDVIQKLKEIAERSPEEIGRAIAAAEAMTGTKSVVEAKKPDFLDLDKDGDKKEPMAKAAKEKGSDKDDDDKDDGKKGMSDKQAKYFGKKDAKESVAEDVQITLTGSDAVLAEILKLAGQIGAKTSGGSSPVSAPAPVGGPSLGGSLGGPSPMPPKPMGMPSTGPVPSLDSMLGDVGPDIGGMEDEVLGDSFEASTTPNPTVMGADAAIPSGDDLSKSKLTAPRVSPGDNPLQSARSF